jgi:hypothetical protein
MYLQIAVPSQSHLEKQNNVAINSPVVYFIGSLPLVLLLTIIGYRKCRTYIFDRRVERLERLWKLSSPEKAS